MGYLRNLFLMRCSTVCGLVCGLFICLGPSAGIAQSTSASPKSADPATGADLDKVIAQLNAAAVKFHSAQADFSWDVYQAVVQDHDIQTGTTYFERGSGTTQMAAEVKQENNRPAPKYVVYNGSQVQFYQPEIKQMTIFRAGANRSQAESFLTLGFGGSGTELQANWEVTPLGREMMNGVEVVKLDLKPKAANVQNTFTHVTIWVDPSRAISLKQIFFAPSGDLRTVTYSNIRYNQPIPKEVFHIKVAPGTTIQTK
jgi:outer membrane lipoprotein-sorting protein